MNKNIHRSTQKQQWPYFYRELNVYTRTDGEIIGTFSLVHQDNKALISDLYVHHNCRNQGYARMMMEDALTEQDRDMTLLVRTDNTHAIKLYESLGFEFVPDLMVNYPYVRMNKNFSYE